MSRKNWIFGTLFLFILVIASGLLFIQSNNQNANDSWDVHVSVRPTKAMPITVSSANGVVGVYTTPEFDITFSSSMRYLVFSSTLYESSEEHIPNGPLLVVNLKEKEDLSKEDIFLGEVSNSTKTEKNSVNTLVDYREYGGGRWLVGKLRSSNELGEREIIVVDNSENNFIVIFAGTSIDPDSLNDYGVPPDIVMQIIEENDD